ncbi:MAG: GntR family transcriptional regulator [Gammaproteobacteria bacterium]|nr:GntR family transcriptional regulator [Gammaproteobacteria bacterium]
MATVTIVENIFNELSSLIISGEIKPGQKLDEQEIADRFHVSRTPIREAFRLLTTSGLIEAKSRKGITVIELDIEQLSDMYEALQELEALCARLCAERMTVLERKQIIRLHEKSRVAVNEENIEEFARINNLIHGAVHSGSRNKTLQETIINLRKRLTLYRQPWLFEKRNRLEKSFAEHQELVDALEQGDKEAAYNAMSNHISNTSLGTIDYLMSLNN